NDYIRDRSCQFRPNHTSLTSDLDGRLEQPLSYTSSLSRYIDTARIDDEAGFSCAKPIAAPACVIFGKEHNRLIARQPISQELFGKDSIRLLAVELAIRVKEWDKLIEIIESRSADGIGHAC
ncbi:MAG: hypothetical protein ACXWWI_00990, partial [Nitrospira sp.]